jgi:hypothetical protein
MVSSLTFELCTGPFARSQSDPLPFRRKARRLSRLMPSPFGHLIMLRFRQPQPATLIGRGGNDA